MKPCCQLESNLETVKTNDKDRTLQICKVCGCKHHSIDVDPIRINLKGVGF